MKPELFHEHYKFEWEHRSYLSSSMNVPIAVATILGSAITVMVQKYPYEMSLASGLFVFFIILVVIGVLIGAYFLSRAFIGYKYQRVPTPLKLSEHYEKLLVWSEKKQDGKLIADAAFEKHFLERLGQATEINADNNKAKSGYLYRCNVSLALALVFLALAAVPYIITMTVKQDEIYSVRIISELSTSSEDIVMGGEDDNENDQRPEEPSEPVMPPNEDIREHEVKPTSGGELFNN